MTRGMLRDGSRLRAVAVLIILLLSAIPLTPSALADDVGDPQLLQAQDISVSYDSVSEATTITWRNIDNEGGVVELFRELWTSYYNVYRHSEMITGDNIDSLVPFTNPILACDYLLSADPGLCRGILGSDPHPGHTVVYEVPPGINNTYYYAITTSLDDGSITTLLDDGASNFSSGVEEVTSPLRSPYNVEAEYNPETGMTTVDWINYNDINPILPVEGNNSYSTNLWLTSIPIDRGNAGSIFGAISPLAVLEAGNSSYIYSIPDNTNRQSYYSVTYNLPNYSTPGIIYHDVRMLSNNAMLAPILEDNIPPDIVTGVGGAFVEDNGQGTGNTTITWNDLDGEDGEIYRIYYSSTSFSYTNESDVYLLAEVAENLEAYTYALPIGTLGYTHYCVVVVDQYGAFNNHVTSSACTGEILEDAFNQWIAEPTNVQAEYIGNSTTVITWTDQVGAEGETYYVWEGKWLVSGENWASDPSVLTQVCEVPDGVQMCEVAVEWTNEGTIPEQITSFYFVTSLARYGQINGSYHYTGLDQNGVGPIFQDIKPPTRVVMSEAVTSGVMQRLDLKWQISSEENETYSVYRHLGEPFTAGDSQVYDISDEGWELIAYGIKDPAVGQYVTYSIEIEDDVDRELWYAVLITDTVGNTDTEIFGGGPSGNAIQVSEDTKVPEVTLILKLKDDNSEVAYGALTAGSYTVYLEADEDLADDPLINVSSSSGESLSSGEQPMFPQGDKYYFPIDISTSTSAGDLVFQVTLVDVAGNQVTHNLSDYSLDAKNPEITIYSPSPSSDGSKYLYGNNIVVIVGITDDVELASVQIKFVRNYGKIGAVNEPWRNVSGLNILSEDNNEWSFQMEFAAGNFEYGQHQVIIRAIDSAGNNKDGSVIFVVDWCRHREDGETICENENPVPDTPEIIYTDPSFADPPYIIVWIISGVSIFSLFVAIIILITSLSAPRKKRGDDDDDDDDWMSEFIGTSAEPDMDDIATGGANKEEIAIAEVPEVEDELDPFDTVNKLERKIRPKKKEVVEIPDDEEDETDDFGFDDDETEAAKVKPKRKITRKPSRKVGRKSVTRKKD
jgi:hypothetical protein